ncbi:hypothetical protein V8J82_04280 [Gymnodinialimonas sp. 2305UL16-5]|uniref:hypothetical protein n=1 Tax=Gymnodinialimonas mytili TaxID=3126503 RepID=UPI003098C838
MILRLFPLLALAVSGPVVAQSALAERPGLWVSVPNAPSTRAPEVVVPQQAVVTPAPLSQAPEIRPVPRPGPVSVTEAPDIALTVVEPVPGGTLINDDPIDLAAPVLEAEPAGPILEAEPRADPIAPPMVQAVRSVPHISEPFPTAPILASSRDAVVIEPMPVALIAPARDMAPSARSVRLAAPAVLEQVDRLRPVSARSVAAILMPGASPQPSPPARSGFAAAPRPDPFPISALPPTALPAGPDAFDAVRAAPLPVPEAMAAVLLAPQIDGLDLPLGPPMPDLPRRSAVPRDPNAPIPLPEPDRYAIALLVQEAEICWRAARLGPEARWATLSVDVALDETNSAAAGSIRLSGFRHVLSSAASEAYSAARAALIGCGAASDGVPVTALTTIRFDPEGVRLQ